MAKIQCSDGLMGKRKIAILNISSILNNIFLGQMIAKVLVTTSPKWVYMLNSVQKWLCERQKKKTVVDGAISI
jgi:uncharacterized membrane protein YcaP (DUF421 family)